MFLIPNSYFEVRQTLKKGKGIFTKKDIGPGVVIGDYLGKVINPFKEGFYEKDKDLFLMYYSDNASIYPDLKKIGIHLLNHSCSPNCFMYTYKGHTLFFALRYIFRGEELTISYQLPPQNKGVSSKDYECKCESYICSKSMHLTEEHFTKWSAFQKKQEKLTNKSIVPFGKNLTKLPTYPKNISDNPIYPLFGSSLKSSQIFRKKILPSIQDLRKVIRKNGRILQFQNLNLKVLGVQADSIYTLPL